MSHSVEDKTTHSRQELAVVIPAYKARHLGEALDSLARQTVKSFRVYIGDDASPEPLAEIVQRYRSVLDLEYKRFETNLGRSSLVKQWERCVELSRSEPWIWLFSDDDIADACCVEAFFNVSSSSAHAARLYRFNLAIIDETGVHRHELPCHPHYEAGPELWEAILRDRTRQWRMADHVFSRELYSTFGFVDFPLALFSDSATWMLYARDGGVSTVRGPRLAWRSHAGSVSAGTGTYRTQYLTAFKEFSEWIPEHLSFMYPGGEARLRRDVLGWMGRQVPLILGRLSEGESTELRKHVLSYTRNDPIAVAACLVRIALLPRFRHVGFLRWLASARHRWRIRRVATELGSEQ